jgi:hypothetical protein
MIDRSHALSVARQARELGISRGSVYYLPRATSAADLSIMRRIDALHMDFPVRWQPDVARPACRRRHQGRPAARLHADEEDGDRGDLPAAEHLEAGAGAQDLSLSAAQARGDAAKPGLGDRHHLHPDGTRLRLSDRHRRPSAGSGGSAGGCSAGAYRSRWRPTSASKLWRKR